MCLSELRHPGPERRRLAWQGVVLRPPRSAGRCCGPVAARGGLSGTQRCSWGARSGRPETCSGPRSGFGSILGREAGLSSAAAWALYRRDRSPRGFALGPASCGTTEGA
ncbi:hypothetical protein NDU88_000450 [Pleurodeles waltl]|uniref:Uncharacterized protein n=1 Tax=Pleurodeles waltl TaxID=8319 RepID=A0AAV7P3S6_PLEWA|nr:hypothetical protein NDU88_000450 [Pleurodeles waltl]